ncbi:MAG: acetyl-CoA acetyltransferase [Alphaproteobacteria bacterium]
MSKVYLLGGHQTDFKRNFAREGKTIFDMMQESVEGALEATGIDPEEIEVAHVGNFVAELFCRQGQLGGLFAAIHPRFSGLPASRHEGACASGSLAALAAQADIKAGHYDLACVLGVEMMRNATAKEAAENLAAAAWIGREGQEAQWMWPWMFAKIGEEYDRRYGLKHEHLAGIAKVNFANARRNPNAQTRDWKLEDANFGNDDDANPRIEGGIRKQDCGQITDGGACVFLASERYAEDWAARSGMKLEDVPYVKGWGHRTATMRLEDKFKEAGNGPYVMPHVRGAIIDAYKSAGIPGPEALDAIETHDCFTTTEYMAIDHFGITKPGESWKAVEEGRIALDGDLPINPSGGLIGLGHPVGCSGVRMLLDAWKQTAGQAGAYQVEGARQVQTLNIGGSGTTTVSFVVAAGA